MKFFLLCIILIVFSQSVFAQTKIDEYGKIITDDEGGRLLHFTEQLKKDEDAKAVIIIHKDKLETTGHFLRYFYGVKKFIVEVFGVSADRFLIVYGGENTRRTEIWLSKSKEESAKFEIKVLDETLAGKINQKILFDYDCIDCDKSPFINQFIFREGIDYLAEALKANPQTKAIIKVARVDYLSKTSKERKDLLDQFFDRLEKRQIQRNRVSVQFTSGMLARFYIIPVKSKNKP